MGIEFFWQYQKGSFDGTLAYNYSALKFDDYILDNNNLSGNHLPGVPQQQLSASLKYLSLIHI